ncbi:MAG: hypothetical protein DRP66_09105 [Planctomycetota bacterium]|nr:MAG: hypothetical protein DRP66_09105 [Planctomycetota bacterium]
MCANRTRIHVIAVIESMHKAGLNSTIRPVMDIWKNYYRTISRQSSIVGARVRFFKKDVASGAVVSFIMMSGSIAGCEK